MIAAVQLLGLCGCATLLSACQTAGNDALVQSAAPAEIAPQTAAAIAEDVVGQFAEQVGPGMATILLRSDESRFGRALEAGLKDRGFAVVTDQATDASTTTALAYVVDDFEGDLLVRLSTHGFDLTRVYRPGPDGVRPISPTSLMMHALDEAQ